jgi:hypothetical protein
VIGDVDGNALGLEALVHLGEVVEALHPPGDVVQPDLTLLRRQGVLTHVEQRDVVGVTGIAGQECSA